MRIVKNLKSGWKQQVIEGGEKNLELPLVYKEKDAPESITLTHEIKIPADEKTAAYYLGTGFLSGRCKLFVDDAPVREFRSVFAPRYTELTPYIKKGEAQTLRLIWEPKARPDGTCVFGAAALVAVGLSHFAVSDETEPLAVHTVFTDAGVNVTLKAALENPNNYDVVLFRLSSPEGILLDVKSARPTNAEATFALADPMLWEGGHAAYRYRAEALLQRDTDVIDHVELSFGIRDFSPTEDGFFTLNGIKTPLNGAFLRGSGTKEDLACLGALDANLVGLCAADADEEILNECDRLGILAFFVFPETGDDADFDELAALTRLLARHPSAAFLSYRSKNPGYAKKFCAAVKQNAQYIYTAGRTDVLDADSLSDAIPDVLLLEYAVKPEKTGFTELQARFEEVLAAHPEYRFAAFPNAPECIFDRHSAAATRPDCSQEYFSMWHARVWEIFSTHKNVVCYFTGALTDETAKSGRTGLVTAEGAEKKDAFWFYKGRFSAEKFVKMASLPASVTRKTVDVKCYTNAGNLTLWVNGKYKKKYVPQELSESVYVFRNVKLKRKNNELTVKCDAGTDKAEVFRSKSKLGNK